MNAPATRFRLLALDVDGTLVRPDQTVAEDVLAALEDAERAGLAIVLATGRALSEVLPVWRQLRLAGPAQPVVLLGGAMVSEPHTRRTLWQRGIDRETVADFEGAVAAMGRSTVASVDVWRHGADYYVAVGDDIDTLDRHWFTKLGLAVQKVPSLAEAPDMPDPLRLLTGVPSEQAESIAETLSSQFQDRLDIHAICAPNLGLHLVEGFAPGVDKFGGVRYVAEALRIAPKHIAAAGDDVNDLAMLRRCGLGAAMPQASAVVRDAADVVATDGLGRFIHDLLAGEYD